jgi:hypothetical protein
MYAVFVEVNAGAIQNDQARQILEGTAVPMARDAGARAGYWLSAEGGRGVRWFASIPKRQPGGRPTSSRWARRHREHPPVLPSARLRFERCSRAYSGPA